MFLATLRLLRRPVILSLSLIGLAWSVLASPAGAADVATAPDGTVTVVSGLRYMRIAPDGSHTAYLDYASPEAEEEGGPGIAIAPDGTATVVWVRSGMGPTTILARRIAPDGTLAGGVLELGQSDDPHVYPEVAVAPDGTATAVWTATHAGKTAVEASRIDPGGTAQPAPTELATETSYQPDVAVAPDGTATVAWQQFGEDRATATARQIAPDGSLGDALQLSSGIGSAQTPAVAMTPDGAAIVTWEAMYRPEGGGGSEDVVEECRIAPGGEIDGAVHAISAEPDAWAPVLAAGPDGTVTIAWWQVSDHSVSARRIEPDGTPATSVVNVSSPAVGSIYPEIGIAEDGSATFVWTNGWQLFSRRLDPDGAPLGAPQELLNSNGHLGLIGMGFDSDGTALPIWSRRLGYYELEYVQQARRLFPDGSAGPIFDLTEPGTEPATWANPESLDFGSAGVGETVVREVEFTNRSVDPTPVSGVSLQGKDAGRFEIVDDSACTGEPLPFVGSCTVTVAFAPDAKGPMEAELALEASAPREPRVVSLAGMALPPEAKGDPPGPPQLSAAGVQTRVKSKCRSKRRALRHASGAKAASNQHVARASRASRRSSLARCKRDGQRSEARRASRASLSQR